MKFVFYTDSTLPWNEKIAELSGKFPDIEFVPQERKTEKDIENAHAFVGGMIPLDHIQLASQLRMIFVSFTGPNMFPLEHLRERGIRISNTHGNARYVAERGIAMALSFYGKIIEYHEDLKNAKWHGIWGTGGLQDTWDSIHGKKCAVIGTGEIGKWIAKYLKAFDCRVIGFKKRPVNGQLEHFDVITLDLEEALEKSEMILIALPLTAETKGMFDAKILSRMRGKLLINLGRASIIDEEGLSQIMRE